MHVRDQDLLGRRALTSALATKLHDHTVGAGHTVGTGHTVGAGHADPGPTVVTIEGPWGSGKSTLLDQVRQRLPRPTPSADAPPRLRVREASDLLRDAPTDARPVSPANRTRGVVTAWFNPWAHQSGEQVWAGLVAEIIEAARPVLYPNENARERYWFRRNLNRVDRYALRRTLHRRMLSPELTLGALGVVASLAIAVAELETTIGIFGTAVPTALLALVVASTFLLLGAAHTVTRFYTGSAARFLPGELFHGPVSSAASPELGGEDPGRSDGLADPLRRARAGSLYLHQHDVSELLADLDHAGYELIVFVDDLDRCRAHTTAEVFEAINLFLAGFVSERRGTGQDSPGDPGGSLRARFVIGLDPVVVAGHLDRVYADLYDPDTALDGEDPSPGWAFLRKLVHLPILVPHVSDAEMFRIVDHLMGAPAGGAGDDASAAIPRQRDAFSPAGPGGWRFERHDELTALFHERLAAQRDRSIREATRQLNAWEFFERVLAEVEPLDDTAERVARSRHVVILAEIVTRWPALQRFLHRHDGPVTGLQALADAAPLADPQWRSVADHVVGPGAHEEALDALRQLLRDYDGPAVAALATRLL
jgi:hypothetical protein